MSHTSVPGWSADSPYALMWPPFVALGLGVGLVMSSPSPSHAAAELGRRA
ncbi:hypothetical protein [Streptomyces lucensis]|nr:hypothetical protein [Streptomyces lucensis]